jgi:hypothetical protein
VVAALFALPLATTTMTLRLEWEIWGSDEPVGSDAGRYFVPIRGSLRADAATSRTTHDAFFGTGRASFQAAGYQRHHAYAVSGAANDLELLGVWTSLANLQSAAVDPAFASFLGDLLAAAPTVTVFATTDWLGWEAP